MLQVLTNKMLRQQPTRSPWQYIKYKGTVRVYTMYTNVYCMYTIHVCTHTHKQCSAVQVSNDEINWIGPQTLLPAELPKAASTFHLNLIQRPSASTINVTHGDINA